MATTLNQSFTGAAGSSDSSAAGVAPALAGAEPQHFLQRIKLFSALTSDECQQVVKRMKRRDFPPHTIIVREGSPAIPCSL